MIYDLCNIGNEHQIDTFYQVAVIASDDLPFFTHLSDNETVQNHVTALPDTSQAFIANLLYNNINVGHTTRITPHGRLLSTRIGFALTPQDTNLKELMDTYNNKEVVVLLKKRNSTHIYGTTAQPLIFKYDELNAPLPGSIKGYSIQVSGETYASDYLIEEVELNIFTRGLAFELAEQL